MGIFQSQWLTALLGFAAFIFGLSVFVQIAQESLKYLLSSKARSFSRELADFLGPWAAQLKKANFQLATRGPFQFLRLRPKGVLLPMNKDQLAVSLVKTAPQWIQRVHQLLNQEAKWQEGVEKAPSPAWRLMLKDLGRAEKGMLGYWNCYEIAQWLGQWGHIREHDSLNDASLGEIIAPKKFDVRELLDAFQQRFLSHVVDAKENYPQFETNFNYAYRRKNLKQTIFIAVVVSLAFNFSVGRIWTRVQRMSPSEAASLAQTYQALYDDLAKEGEAREKAPEEVQDRYEEIKGLLAAYIQELAVPEEKPKDASLLRLIRPKDVAADPVSWPWLKAWVSYFFQCLLTGLLVGVGAPVWNDIVSLLLGLQQGKTRKLATATGGERG